MIYSTGKNWKILGSTLKKHPPYSSLEYIEILLSVTNLQINRSNRVPSKINSDENTLKNSPQYSSIEYIEILLLVTNLEINCSRRVLSKTNSDKNTLKNSLQHSSIRCIEVLLSVTNLLRVLIKINSDENTLKNSPQHSSTEYIEVSSSVCAEVSYGQPHECPCLHPHPRGPTLRGHPPPPLYDGQHVLQSGMLVEHKNIR